VRTLVEVGLANACAAGLLALLALAAGRWSRRPALVHSLWLLVLIKLVTPPLVALPLPIAWPEQPAAPNVTPAPETIPVALAEPPAPPVKDQPAPRLRNRLAKVRDFQGPDAAGLPLPQPIPEAPGGVEPLPVVAGPGVEPNLERIARAIVPVPPRPAWPMRWLIGAALGVWAAGAAGWFALMAYRIARFQRLLKHARRAGPELQEQARDLARRLGLTHCPEVWLIPGPLPPLLWVVGRARLYFPSALLTRLSTEGRASLLVHELAHLARRDHWVRLVELVANGLYWWYPLVWYARRRLQAAEEECCDAWVVSELPGAAPHYAGALLETIDFLAGARPALPPAASGFGRMYFLKRRLSMIVGSATPRSLSRAGRLVILLLAAALLPLGFSSARPDDAKDNPKTDAPATTPPKVAEVPGMAEEPANYGPQSTVLQAIGNGQVWSVAVSPDGKFLAVGSGGTQPGGELTLWDLAEGKELAALKEKEPVRWVEYSPDGKWLATCGFDNIIKLRDPRTGRARAELKGHPGKINCIRFTPDSKKILSAGLDKLIKVWDVEKAKEIASLTEHTDRVLSVFVSKDGKLFASASGDKTAILWDMETLKPKQTFKGHTAQVEGVALSNDNKTLVTTGFDNTVRFWNAATGEEKAVKRAHTTPVTVVTISPDGKYFATAAYGSTLRFWDPDTGNEVFSIDPIHQQPTYGLRFTPDGKEIITGSFDKTVKVWTVATQKLRVTLTPRSQKSDSNFPVWAIAWSRDGRKVAVAGEDKAVKVLDAATGELLFRLEGHEQAVHGVAFSPDGSLIATAGGDDNTVRIWNASTGQERFTLKGHKGTVYHVAFSPDGQTLASASYDKTARLWDVTTGLELKVLKGHRASVRSVAWAPDGKTLATGSGDKTVKLWNVAKGEAKATLKGHEGAVRSVAFHPKGTIVASGGEDGMARLWDVASAKQVGSAQSNSPPTPDGAQPQRNYVTAVAFSPRGRTLVAVGMDLTVHVLDPQTGAQRGQLRGHTDFIMSLAFSPDGKTLMTAGLDNSLRRWAGSVPPPTPRVAYQDSTVQAWFAVFSPDGKRLVSGGDDGNLHLRRVDLNRKVPVLQGPTGGLYTIAFTRDGKTMATCGSDTLVRLWELPSGKLLKTLRPKQMDGDGPPLPVWSVAFSPDGKQVASCTGAFNQKDQPGRVQVWDVKTGEEVANLPGDKHTSLIVSVAFSPDGKWLATAGWEGVVNVWKADGFAHHKTLKANDQPVRSLCFHPKNGLLAAGGFDGAIRLYDPETGKEEGKFTPAEPLINSVSFSADGKRLAAVYNKKTGPDDNPLGGEAAPGAVVWDYESKKEIVKLAKEIKGKMLSGALSPDGKLLATGGGVNNKYGSVQLWDVDTGKEVTKLSGPRNWVEGVTFSPDGKLLASTGATPPAQPANPNQPQPAPGPAVRNDVTIWDLAEERGRLRLEGHTKHVAHAAFTRDGKLLATAGGADRSIRLWDGETGESKGVLNGHEGDVRRVAFSPDGKTLYSCGDDHTVRVWDVGERKLEATHKVSDDSVYAMALSPDGKTLAVGTGDWRKMPAPQGKVMLLDPETGKVKATLTGFGREVWSVAFSPNGKYLAAGAGANQGMNVMLRLYDAQSGKVLQEKAVAPYIRSVAFSPDGKMLAAGLGNGQVKLFAVEGLVEKTTLPGVAPQLVFCVVFSPDGNLLATSANDGGVKLWDVPGMPKAVAAAK
jgi:WD40 repeat protein/beta-lactamase regulating signal transducer with metallopeptidase domain